MKIIYLISQLIIPVFIFFVIFYGFTKKVKVYDSFINGAKDGINLTLRIFPYILAIFIAIKTFQVSGIFDFVKNLLYPILNFFSIPLEVLSISIIKPLSGSASIGVFTDIVKTTGPDSFASKVSAVIMGSAETTFYVLAVYLGAAGIKKTKYLIPVCVISDIIGIVIAIIVTKILLG
ncbi:MAG: spore maturation protein [Elusimicrobiota bacterium]|nr:spore maturation protein [Elusimicrobiota bacterium]